MTSILLSWSDQLSVGAFWALTILIAYLRGGNVERDRHIATLESQIAFLRELDDDEPEAAP